MKEGILSATGKTLSLSDPSRKGQGEYKCYQKKKKKIQNVFLLVEGAVGIGF